MTILLIDGRLSLPSWLDESAKTWVIATAGAIAVLILVALPVLERVKAYLGGFAGPLIAEHDDDSDAHAVALKDVRAAVSELKTAVGILDTCIRSQQGQIDKIDATRRETLQLVMTQVQQAVDLLSRS